MSEQDRLTELTHKALAGDKESMRQVGQMVLGGAVKADEPHQERIEKTRSPNFPQFMFEWHPRMGGKIYMIELPGVWAEGRFVTIASSKALPGVCIAEHCEHHARFLGFVQTFLRGYKKAKEETRK